MIDEIQAQLALRSKLLQLAVATTGTISLAATTTGYTRGPLAGAGTVTALAGVATFSTSQAGKLVNGYTITVGVTSYTVSAFNGTTSAVLSGAPTFAASAFTITDLGSFLADGFAPGMEAVSAGFGTNGPAVITDVTALTIVAQRVVATTTNGKTTYALAAITAEAAASGRSLTVGLPSNRSWENDYFEPTAGIPWVREEFIPGPTQQITMGPTGELEATPMYAMYFNAPAGTRLTAKRYVQAARVLFAPRTKMTLANGDTLRVRADTGPYAGQLQQSTPGFAVQPFTVPLRLRSANII